MSPTVSLYVADIANMLLICRRDLTNMSHHLTNMSSNNRVTNWFKGSYSVLLINDTKRSLKIVYLFEVFKIKFFFWYTSVYAIVYPFICMHHYLYIHLRIPPFIYSFINSNIYLFLYSLAYTRIHLFVFSFKYIINSIYTYIRHYLS